MVADHPAVEGVVIGHRSKDPPGRPEVAPIRLARFVELGIWRGAEIAREHGLAPFEELQRPCCAGRDLDLWKGQACVAVCPLVIHQLGRPQVDQLPADRRQRSWVGLRNRVVVSPVSGLVFVNGPAVWNGLPEELFVGEPFDASSQPGVAPGHRGRQQLSRVHFTPLGDRRRRELILIGLVADEVLDVIVLVDRDRSGRHPAW